MNKIRYYDLAYTFRDSKIWKQIFEEELFAVKLSSDPNKSGDASDSIGYCMIMGRGGDHIALAVYIGAEGFTSYRKVANITPEQVQDVASVFLEQDCIHCSLEQKDQFDPEILKLIKAYCQKTERPFRAPFPLFTRFSPYRMPWDITDARDWNAIKTALSVTEKLSQTVKQSGKAALGLRPVFVEKDGQSYGPVQMDLFGTAPPDDEVTIPLYSIVKGELVVERIPLPPYTERSFAAPGRIDEKAIAKMKRNKQKGVYECEVVRLPEPVEGEPPYVPAILITVDESGYLLKPAIGEGAVYDPDQLLNSFIESLGSAYPKAIKVRTAETKILLEDFCREANILLAVSQDMDGLDEALDSLMREYADDDEDDYDDDDYDDDDEADEIEAIVFMLREMSIQQIRKLPDFLIDQILENAAFFPADVVKKVQKAKRK